MEFLNTIINIMLVLYNYTHMNIVLQTAYYLNVVLECLQCKFACLQFSVI